MDILLTWHFFLAHAAKANHLLDEELQRLSLLLSLVAMLFVIVIVMVIVIVIVVIWLPSLSLPLSFLFVHPCSNCAQEGDAQVFALDPSTSPEPWQRHLLRLLMVMMAVAHLHRWESESQSVQRLRSLFGRRSEEDLLQCLTSVPRIAA